MTAATTLTNTSTANPLAKYQSKASTTTTTSSTDANQTALNKLTDDYTTFLKLLTTQLQNQDPTNPMDSSQFTQQLVQYSQVEQQIKSNQKLDTLISGQNALNGVGNSLGYLGKTIEMDGNQFTTGSTGGSFNFALSDVASNVKIEIKDSSGAVVRTTTASSGAIGKHTVSWDGKDDDGKQLSPGVYSVNVTATNSAGTAVTTKVTTNGIVDGVEKDSSGNVVLDVGKLQLTTDKILAIHDTTIAPAAAA